MSKKISDDKFFKNDNNYVTSKLIQDLSEFDMFKNIFNSTITWTGPNYSLVGTGKSNDYATEMISVKILTSDMKEIFTLATDVVLMSDHNPIVAKEIIYSIIYAYAFCDATLTNDSISCNTVNENGETYRFNLMVDNSRGIVNMTKLFLNLDNQVEERVVSIHKTRNKANIKASYNRDRKINDVVAKEKEFSNYIAEKKEFELDLERGIPFHMVESHELKNMNNINGKGYIYADRFFQYPTTNYRKEVEYFRVDDSKSVAITKMKNVLPSHIKALHDNYISYSIGANGQISGIITHMSPKSISKSQFDSIMGTNVASGEM